MSRKTIAVACLLSSFASVAFACLWDYDTLQMERMRFPGALEIITGKFVRHSRAYYEWRIADRKKKLEAKPDDPALLDDLAVAYAKLGRPEEGIALLEPTLVTRPDRYETLSNLGTLLFFAGRLEESKQYIRRAMEINPNAHFGREKYQLLLTEYVQQSQRNELGVMSDEGKYAAEFKPRVSGFAHFVLQSKFGGREWNYFELQTAHMKEIQDAVRGVLGMMHFADYQSPILLEALGDLLLTGTMEKNATLLAARAYLRAAKLSPDPAVAARFREMSQQAVSFHIDFNESGVVPDKDLPESQWAKEVATAEVWFAEIEAKEKAWIAAGRDVDREFAAVYYDSLDKTVAAAEKQLKSEPRDRRPSQSQRDNGRMLAAGAICVGTPLVLIGLGIASIVWWHRRARVWEKQVMGMKSAASGVGPAK